MPVIESDLILYIKARNPQQLLNELRSNPAVLQRIRRSDPQLVDAVERNDISNNRLANRLNKHN